MLHILICDDDAIFALRRQSAVETLLESRGRTVGAREMAARVWDDAFYISRSDALAVHIRHLREKLGDTKKPFSYILTDWGKGYRVE